MKTKISLILIALLFLSGTSFSQKTKTKKKTVTTKSKTQKKEIVYKDANGITDQVMEIQSDAIMEAPPEAIQLKSNYQSNLKYSSKYAKAGYQLENSPDSNNLTKVYTNNGSYESLNGLLNNNDELVLPIIFKNLYNLGNTFYTASLNNKYGVYDSSKNKWVVPLVYDNISNTDDKNHFIVSSNNKYGLIDKFNNPILPQEYNSIYKVYNSNDLYVLQQNKKRAVYSVLGKSLIIPFEYDEIDTYASENTGFVKVTKDGQENFINFNNIQQFKTWYTKIQVTNNNDRYIVQSNGKFGCIDKSGTIIHPLDLVEITNYPLKDGSYIAKNNEGKTGSINIDGTKSVVVLPFIYDSYRANNDNTFITMKNGKCGLVKSQIGSQTEILQCDYDKIDPFSNILIVSKNGKYGVLDSYGKELIPITNDFIKFPESDYYTENYIIVTNKNKSSLYDKTGNLISNPFDEINAFKNYKNYKIGNKFGLLSNYGKELTEPIFEKIIGFDGEYLTVKVNEKYGIYSVQSKTIVLKNDYDFISNSENDKLKTGYKNSKFYKIVEVDKDKFEEVEIK